MKKIIIALIACILMSTMALAATVSRDVPSRVSPGEELTVKLNIDSISTSDTLKTFAIEEAVPSGWSLSDWSVTGVLESKEDITTETSDNEYKFQFTPTGTSVTITYKTTASTSLGDYGFKATWFDLSGMSGADDGKTTVTVRTITCGDGFCEGDENLDTCEADCPKPAPPAEAPAEAEPEVAKKTPWTLIIVAAIVIIGIIVFVIVKKKKQ